MLACQIAALLLHMKKLQAKHLGTKKQFCHLCHKARPQKTRFQTGQLRTTNKNTAAGLHIELCLWNPSSRSASML